MASRKKEQAAVTKELSDDNNKSERIENQRKLGNLTKNRFQEEGTENKGEEIVKCFYFNFIM